MWLCRFLVWLVGWLVLCVCVCGGGGGVVVVVVFFGGKTAAPSQRDLLKSARSYSWNGEEKKKKKKRKEKKRKKLIQRTPPQPAQLDRYRHLHRLHPHNGLATPLETVAATLRAAGPDRFHCPLQRLTASVPPAARRSWQKPETVRLPSPKGDQPHVIGLTDETADL